MGDCVMQASTGRTDAGSLWRWIRAGRFALVTTLALVTSYCFAQTTWQADLPRSGTGEREAAFVTQLSQRLASGRVPVRLVAARERSAAVAQALAQVESGQTQLTIVPTSALVDRSPEFAVFESIFLFKDLAAIDQFTSSSGNRLLASLRSRNLRGLAFLHGGMVQLVSTRPLVAGELPRGLKLGTSAPGEAYVRQFQSLGLAPQRLAFAEVFAAVQRGAVDAAEAGWPELSQGASGELYILESNHRYRGYVVLANNAAFERLPQSTREHLLAEAKAAAASYNETARSAENAARERALRDARNSPAMSRKDYDALLAKLARGGWMANREAPHRLTGVFANALALQRPRTREQVLCHRLRERAGPQATGL